MNDSVARTAESGDLAVPDGEGEGFPHQPTERRLATLHEPLYPFGGMMTAVAPPGPGWGGRMRRSLAVLGATLPLYADLAGVWLLKRATAWSRGIRGRFVLSMSVAGVIFVVLAIEDPLVADLLAFVSLGPLLILLFARLRRRRKLFVIASASHPLDGLPTARETLLRLGVEAGSADRVVASSTAEVRLAVFDYLSRVMSLIGPIPFFQATQVTAEEFLERDRHRLELVIYRGVVCAKKMYLDRSSFENELLALDALEGIPEVPRIVAVSLAERTLYQSFIAGRSLGSIMVGLGATDEIQHQVSVSYAEPDRWNLGGESAQTRTVALRALAEAIAPDVIQQLARIMDRIHQRGVTIGDVKYGNVLLTDGQPSLCDFDFATVFPRNSWRCVRGRESDRDKFNYFFDGQVLSERVFEREMASLLRERQALANTRILYGNGYTSQPGGSLALGSGQWRLLRAHLPALAGRSVLDLGGSEGLVPLEMLRAGARRVTVYESEAALARYLELNHRWFEFIDNRPYPGLELFNEAVRDGGTHDWAGYDVAIAMGGIGDGTPETAARLVKSLGESVRWLVIRPGGSELAGGDSLAALRELLTAGGYVHQTVIDTPDGRPIVMSRRAGS